MMAAVANGGQLVTPRLGRESGATWAAADDDSEAAGAPLFRPESRPIADLAPGTLERVREGLRQVVASPQGTGKALRLKEVAVAGKTGTAETGGRPDHAWFAGYVPADRPRYAFVVVLEHAGSGGRMAAPVAKKLVEAMLTHGTLEPQPVRIQASRN
jgi:penicillin-binding protein 2